MQIVDFGDVLFQPLSSSKIICSGAKPSASLVPEKLLFLTPKVTYDLFHKHNL